MHAFMKPLLPNTHTRIHREKSRRVKLLRFRRSLRDGLTPYLEHGRGKDPLSYHCHTSDTLSLSHDNERRVIFRDILFFLAQKRQKERRKVKLWSRRWTWRIR